MLLQLLTADTAEALMEMAPYYKKMAVELIKEFRRLAETARALTVVLLPSGEDELFLITTKTTRLEDIHRKEMFADLQRALMDDLTDMHATLKRTTENLPKVLGDDGDEALPLGPLAADELLYSRQTEVQRKLQAQRAARKEFVRASEAMERAWRWSWRC